MNGFITYTDGQMVASLQARIMRADSFNYALRVLCGVSLEQLTAPELAEFTRGYWSYLGIIA